MPGVASSDAFMPRSEATHFQQIRAFVGCAVDLGAALALIVEDPAAIGVLAYFEALRVVVDQ